MLHKGWIGSDRKLILQQSDDIALDVVEVDDEASRTTRSRCLRGGGGHIFASSVFMS